MNKFVFLFKKGSLNLLQKIQLDLTLTVKYRIDRRRTCVRSLVFVVYNCAVQWSKPQSGGSGGARQPPRVLVWETEPIINLEGRTRSRLFLTCMNIFGKKCIVCEYEMHYFVNTLPMNRNNPAGVWGCPPVTPPNHSHATGY